MQLVNKFRLAFDKLKMKNRKNSISSFKQLKPRRVITVLAKTKILIFKKNSNCFPKKLCNDIDGCITGIDLLSLKGDPLNQKDLVIDDLVRTRQRFVSRINDNKALLQMLIKFFTDYSKV
jgi:hypothetical protein